MGWLEASVKIVTALAWPAVVLVAVILLRREIGQVFRRLNRFAGPAGIEAEFREEVAATSELAEVAAPDKPDELALPSQRDGAARLAPNPTLSDLIEEAERHPVGGVMRAWHLVEDALNPRETGRRLVPSYQRLMELRREGVISDDLFVLGRRLQELRNKVAHGRVIPDPPEVRDFVTSTWRLAAALNQLPTESALPPFED
ncbi:hypothetical protein [Micromonospora sp. KC721]|uniref:hypothetical protein n=1 Tax=Micromonospora sp. KC721 TaxID=2530380 RepID=UPI00104DB338|nr:hypothetical protein [Micromonospora sp. KC721]TDB79621.1 hypothetical protein E1182_12070 [Micromonospora sp. KC721]